MKKSIFVLAVLFGATFANAQITLEHTFDGVYFCKSMNQVAYNDETSVENVDFPFFYSYTNPGEGSSTDIQITLVNPFDYSTYKTVNLNYEQIVGHPCTDTYWGQDGESHPSSYSNDGIFAFTYNIFVPNKVAFIVPITTYQGMGGYYIYGYYIVDEDGVAHKSFLRADGYTDSHTKSLMLTRIRNEYKLIAYKYLSGGDLFEGTYHEELYTEIYSVPGKGGDYAGTTNPSAPKRNTRKYINEAQVLVDSNEKTYNMQGLQVK